MVAVGAAGGDVETQVDFGVGIDEHNARIQGSGFRVQGSGFRV